MDGVAPQEAGDDGEGEQGETCLYRARAEPVGGLEARDQVVERPRRARAELALLDEIEEAPAKATKRAA
jgi:hypothetical protein